MCFEELNLLSTFSTSAFICDSITSAQAGQGLQDALTEGSNGILNAGSKAQRVLQVRLLHQQLPVRHQLRCSGQQGSDTVHKFWHQTGVGVVSLTEMVCNHLGVGEGERHVQESDCMQTELPQGSDLVLS